MGKGTDALSRHDELKVAKNPEPSSLSLWVPPFAQGNVMTWLTGWGSVSPTEDTADTEELHPFEDLDRYRHSGAGHMTVKLAVNPDQRQRQVCRALSALDVAALNSVYIPVSNMLEYTWFSALSFKNIVRGYVNSLRKVICCCMSEQQLFNQTRKKAN